MSKDFICLGCGIDVSKDKLDICLGAQRADKSFKIIAQRKTFKNTVSDIKKLVKWLQSKLKAYPTDQRPPFRIILESTGTYHERVLLALYEADLPVCLERADRVKGYLRSIGQYSKNDQLDARGIAQMACERKTRLWKPFSPNILALRSVLRLRSALVSDRTRLKNRIHAQKHASYANRTVKGSLKRLVKQLDREIAALEKEMVRLYQQDEQLRCSIDPIVRSLPGVSLLSALTVFSETNGFSNIKGRRALTRYAGLNVIEHQSGTTQRKTQISKRGNDRIRTALYMCAMSHIRQAKGNIYNKYVRICQRNPKVKKIGLTAVMRELLELIYTLHKTGRTYVADYQWSPTEPEANSPSTAKKSTPELSPEVHGIAA